MRDWSDPTTLDDVISFRAFANYLREYITRFSELDQHLNTATKQGIKWHGWVTDPRGMEASREMKTTLSNDAALCMPGYAAAQGKESGMPLELCVDACGDGRGCTLAQRQRKGGAPQPIV